DPPNLSARPAQHAGWAAWVQLRAAFKAVRTIGTWSGRRPKATALNPRLRLRAASPAIFRLAGNTPTRTAALAHPAVRRAAGTDNPAAHSSSRTPDHTMTSWCAGTQSGMSGS